MTAASSVIADFGHMDGIVELKARKIVKATKKEHKVVPQNSGANNFMTSEKAI